MTVVAAMQSAALRLMGQRPQPMFGGATGLPTELCDLVNEVAQDVAKYQDWQTLIRTKTYIGDGVNAALDLPDDYDRMMINSAVQDTASWAWGYYPYTDINTFLFDQARGFHLFPGGWIIYQSQIHFTPAPPAGATATFPYVSKNIVLSATSAPKTEFTADDDTFVLPERLLTLGLVWRWREQKKLDASGDQEAFIKALDEYGAKDKGSRVSRRRSFRRMPGVGMAYPWALGG